jgi:micrococcal nuclease
MRTPSSSCWAIETSTPEDLDVCLRRYRDNVGRLLPFARRSDTDFQEHMIRTGFSPYFTEYGHAKFDDHRDRYVAAERAAQPARLCVWDQMAVNGPGMRNCSARGERCAPP